MSKTGVIVSLVAALGLAVVAVIVLREPNEPAGPTRVLGFHESEVVSLVVRGQSGVEECAERLARGGWSYVLADGVTWPIDRSAVDGALRLLAALVGEPEQDVGEQSGWYEIEFGVGGGDGGGIGGGDGGVWRMWCQPTELGGSRSVRVVPPDGEAYSARVEGEVFAALFETGLGARRMNLALPELSLDVSRISLDSPRGSVRLARTGGRWRIIEPVAVAADEQAVTMLLRRLAGVEVVRFLEGDVDRAALGLESPISVAVVEREIMSVIGGQQVRQTERRSLIVGGAVDVAATRINAQMQRRVIDASGADVGEPVSVYFEIGVKALEQVEALAVGYVSKRSAETPRAEVGTITVRALAGGVRFEQTIDGWVAKNADGSGEGGREGERVLLDEEAVIGSLLELLCEQDASVSIAKRADVEELFEIELGSLSGQPLETLTLGRLIGGEPVVRKGDVNWEYAGDVSVLQAWLAGKLRG